MDLLRHKEGGGGNIIDQCGTDSEALGYIDVAGGGHRRLNADGLCR